MEITKINIQDLKNMYGKENIIILVHATWCGACQNFKPTWDKFTENFPKDKNSKKVKVLQIEDSQLQSTKRNKVIKDLMSNFQGYPTVFYINKNKDMDMLIGGDKTIRQLKLKMNKFFKFNKKK
tara:strand:- start:847 stop:1218 length:372 start_codon:yes stop_codon:yes gene_type:complete